MSKFYLFDIEGTTTDINFVHQVLFPYSQERIREFLLEHKNHPQVLAAIEDVKKTVKTEEHIVLTDYEVVNRLEQWIEQDRKHGALKEIQGLIWNEGYQQKHFQGHLYPDVKPFFERILQSGGKIGIYSSGSVQAQKLIFAHSNAGDLTPFISNYFDTKVGGKREKKSYQKIASSLNLPAPDIHFFSDIIPEIAAAGAAGMKTSHVIRDFSDLTATNGIKDFDQLKL